MYTIKTIVLLINDIEILLNIVYIQDYILKNSATIWLYSNS